MLKSKKQYYNENRMIVYHEYIEASRLCTCYTEGSWKISDGTKEAYKHNGYVTDDNKVYFKCTYRQKSNKYLINLQFSKCIILSQF